MDDYLGSKVTTPAFAAYIILKRSVKNADQQGGASLNPAQGSLLRLALLGKLICICRKDYALKALPWGPEGPTYDELVAA